MSYQTVIANDSTPPRRVDTPSGRIRLPRTHYVGLDLGKKRDYTAVAVLAREREEREPLPGTRHPQTVNVYTLSYLDRTRQESYEDVADGVANLMRTPMLGTATLAVDETGVGTAVTDMLKARRLIINAVTITGGDTMTRDGSSYRIPKRDLVTTVTVLLEGRRLVVPKSLVLADTLAQELANFRVTVSKLGHDSYGAGVEWREGAHDDLVLAVALAAWFGENDTSGYVEFSPADRQRYTQMPDGHWVPDYDDDDDWSMPSGSVSFGPFGRGGGTR